MAEEAPVEVVTVEIHPDLSASDLLAWLPIITQALMLYPELKAATAGQTVNSPTIPNARIAGGHFDTVVSFTKK